MSQKLHAKTKGSITLKGSTSLVTEYFEYAINQILFLRGIYPEEDFKRTQVRGLNTQVTTDMQLIEYLKKILDQVRMWLNQEKLSRLVLTINSRETRETLERWQFNIELEENYKENKTAAARNENGEQEEEGAAAAAEISVEKTKTESEINRELRDIIKQIVSTVTFMPTLVEKCTFNVLVYTENDVEVPTAWVDSDPHHVRNPEVVKLRTLNTDIHKVDTMVSYRRDEELC
ncbi:Mitotic spindle checkpoint component mad2 [Mycoemilia scoparia]|uniref:Mitotic spindle checkpoint component mad2 n=1 Tax=Mycoemilia scoparia TaxID=417184 RepID=A0A9W7ZX16_9FUNG|nr:Mitotic spindle checkpoint component mad2 [Mycoemilia scoparia]